MQSLKIKPQNSRQLIAWLTSGKLKLNPLWHKRSYRWKFLLRSTIIFPQSLRWLEKLAALPHLERILTRQSNLPCKLHRPYLSSVFSTKNACDALIKHYEFITQKLSPEIFNRFMADKPCLIATLTGKNNEQFLVTLVSEDRYGREGEFTFSFISPEQGDLARLTFSIIEYNNQISLFIGGLQGAESNVDHQAIQQATKACHGLFPKRLLVEVACYFAEQFNISQIIAVGNQSHIYRNWRYRRQYKHIHSDYDSFWLSLDGKENAMKLFQLPLIPLRKPIEDIASKKRAEYRRRYELLDNFKIQALAAFS